MLAFLCKNLDYKPQSINQSDSLIAIYSCYLLLLSEEQARLKAEEQLQRQNEVEQKLAAEKQTLRERAEDQARHLEADQMQNLENRRKYMEEHERFMAEQDARRQQLKEEHDREMAEQRVRTLTCSISGRLKISSNVIINT